MSNIRVLIFSAGDIRLLILSTSDIRYTKLSSRVAWLEEPQNEARVSDRTTSGEAKNFSSPSTSLLSAHLGLEAGDLTGFFCSLISMEWTARAVFTWGACHVFEAVMWQERQTLWYSSFCLFWNDEADLKQVKIDHWESFKSSLATGAVKKNFQHCMKVERSKDTIWPFHCISGPCVLPPHKVRDLIVVLLLLLVDKCR